MSRAVLALGALAVNGRNLGGVVLGGSWGPHRDRWLTLLRERCPAAMPWVRVPAGVDAGRLEGGLDLALSLAANRAVRAKGLVEAAGGGALVLVRADQLAPAQLAPIVAAIDEREVLAVVLDESGPADPPVPASLVERLAIRFDLDGREELGAVPSIDRCAAARARVGGVSVPERARELACRVAMAFGIGSLRAPQLMLGVARALAALADRTAVDETDLTAAAELVLAPRAVALPEATPPPAPPEDSAESADDPGERDGALEDRVAEAVKAAIPEGLLAALAGATRDRATAGRSGEQARGRGRGRVVGHRAGDPRRGRLHLYATLLAAAPWQRIRVRPGAASRNRLAVRGGDLRIQRVTHRTATTTIFAVDASGSAALHRLAEAKGAVEALLAESYVRRDHVALITFRGTEASVALPPTRSLTRARRALIGLPGGGGTPLAAGIASAAALAEQARRAGTRPVVVLLTDGRANIDRHGNPGRPAAEADAVAAARALGSLRLPVVVIDFAPRPSPFASVLAAEMAARYLPLPVIDGGRVTAEVRAARGPGGGR